VQWLKHSKTLKTNFSRYGEENTDSPLYFNSFGAKLNDTGGQMTKSELIEKLADKLNHLSAKDVEHAIKEILEMMAQSLSKGERIEIRGFGSFSLHFRAPRVGRNPKTGESVELTGKYVPHFKPGKELRERVNLSIA